MANLNELMPRNIPPPDPIEALGKLGVLTNRRLETVRSKVLSGEFPSAFVALVKRLVRERILTSFQARTILSGKTKELVLGRYILLRPVARGAMGRVYKAYHRMLGRVVAIKLVAANAPSQRAISRFKREMRLVGRLDHPNIVVAYDAGRCNGVFFIAMEFLSGQTLKDMLDLRGPLPPAKVIGYAAEAARGLAHAHARGIVHRDIKPSNLLLSEDSRIKILDLGLGILMDEVDGLAAGETGKLVGTAEYISPEQACQKPVDGRSDLYSLGCTMYHLIQGKPPFSDRPWVERLAIRVAGDTDAILGDLADEPRGLVGVMEKLLARNPDDRFQTADEAAEALLALARAEAVVVQPTPVLAGETAISPSAGGERHAKGFLRPVAAATVLLALGFGYKSLAPESKRESPETASRKAARSIRQVDEIPWPQAAESIPPARVADERPPIKLVPPVDVAQQPEDVAERPSVKLSQGRALARLASILPRDLGPVRQALLRMPLPTPRNETNPGPAVSLPKPADSGRDLVVAGPSPMTKPGNIDLTSHTPKPRTRPAPVAEDVPPPLEEPLKSAAHRSPMASPPDETNRLAKANRATPESTIDAVKDWTADSSVRKSSLVNEGKAPPVLPPVATVTLAPPMRTPERDRSRPGRTESVAPKPVYVPQPAVIHVLMPTANADLNPGGAHQRSRANVWTGSKRVFTTPALDGTTDYTVTASWKNALGKPVRREKKFQVKPGRVYLIDLKALAPTATEILK